MGKSPSWQDAGGACSGYLVEDGDTCLLVDCGSGVFSKLRRFRDYVDVDAVVITHMHADHFLDLIPFACALTYAPRQQPVPVERWPGTDTPARPQLLVPSGAKEILRTVASAGGQPYLLDEAFAMAEYDTSQALDVGSLRVRFQPVPHFLPSNAIQVTCAAGGRFTFGADHGPTDALDGFADGSDLMILEATLPRPERSGPRGHLTSGEAGEHAARCRAGRLVLTHISDELDWESALAEARRAFDGPVEVAREGAVYEL
ncbi:MAG: MBL fold metallo-hydrolase [Solirubrobacteraceae bacterium]